jgi:hypothetical protein
MSATEYLDRPPPGWFALNVAKAGDTRKWDWVGFLVDVDPDELKHCQCKTIEAASNQPAGSRPAGFPA